MFSVLELTRKEALIVAGAIATVITLMLRALVKGIKKRGKRKRLGKEEPLSAEDYLGLWEHLRVGDRSGCYVISIYDKKPSDKEVRQCKNYDEIYIGQSINVYRRVRNHLTGHGNGDVYADLKYGKFVYVRFVFCSKAHLNRIEKDLISRFNATKSYNRTGGGAKLS